MRSGSTRFTIGGLIVIGLIAGAVALRSDRFGTTSGTVSDGEGFTAFAGLDDAPNPPPSHPRPTHGTQFYVAPDGKPQGDGSSKHPWDLATALSQPEKVKPGGTIWLRSGTYKGNFKSKLTGDVDQPILVSQFANERATIDGSLTVDGAWATFWGFEVMNSSPDRADERRTGVEVWAPHTKFINLLVHDCGNGFGFWSSAVDSELYGNIVFNNGWQGFGRGHGHGIYTQNEEGLKLIRDNIIFNQFGYGIHAYTERGDLNGLYFEGNVSFNNGASSRDGVRYDNILIGGYKPAERITLTSNLTYNTFARTDAKPNVRLGYADTNNKDLIMKDNYFAGGDLLASFRRWEVATVTGNTFIGVERLLDLAMDPDAEASNYTWDHNTYYQSQRAAAFSLSGEALEFGAWRSATGFDQNSNWSTNDSGPAAATRIFIRQNHYEPERAHIVVYNWELKTTVDIDARSFLRVGDSYEVRSVQHYFGAPVLGGTFDGRPLRLPMTGLRVVAAVGSSAAPRPTGPVFNVFVVLKGPAKRASNPAKRESGK